MEIGEWVCGLYKGQKYSGFLLKDNGDNKTIHSTMPPHLGVIVVPNKDVWNNEDILISPDDIPSLIDISLYFRDEEMFYRWTNELKSWKPVEEVLCFKKNNILSEDC